ncbi:MAG TPA: TfoX/Sxy family protein [Anaeromyxobacteraceae bacterium]|nr:TfoX/Sxy family protein [Anaeromyxobacteraceae bacterium]
MGAPLPSLVAHVLELLEPLGPARARAMMGGWMFHLRGLPVALIADERLYLKVDALTREAFAEAGGEPFTYARGRRRIEFSYWSPPDGALDGAEAMGPWAEKALAAAWRSRRSSRARSGPRRR